MKQPHFSIAVTTFDRVDLLRETIASILAQSEEDFEILVGNDNQSRKCASLFPDLVDQRIRWIDHPENLGYVGNINRLLYLSRGRYFTSLSDDDLFHPHFLKEVKAILEHKVDASVVFTDYADDFECLGSAPEDGSSVTCFSGEVWLEGYLSKSIRAIGCYGVFKKAFFQSLGGVHTLGSDAHFSPYNDNLLAVQAAQAEGILYLPKKLIYFRLHAGSPSYSADSVDAFSSAQQDFIEMAEMVFDRVSESGSENLYMHHLLKWFIADYFHVNLNSKKLNFFEMAKYYLVMLRRVLLLRSRAQLFLFLNKQLFVALALHCLGWVGIARRKS